MSEINRYTLRRCRLHFEPHVCLCGTYAVPNGDLVLYSDYAALEAENGRLKAPVSIEEWDADYGQPIMSGKDLLSAIIAARALQPSPAQDKEQG